MNLRNDNGFLSDEAEAIGKQIIDAINPILDKSLEDGLKLEEFSFIALQAVSTTVNEKELQILNTLCRARMENK